MTSWTRDYFTLSAHQKPVVGDIKMSTIPTDHMGWLLCDGRSLPKETYLFLFNVIGYSYGGSGNNFTLPRSAGRVTGNLNKTDISGYDSGLSTRNLGADVGEETHTLTIAEMPSHNHGTNASDSVVGNNLTGSAGAHTHTINDPGHAHAYNSVAASLATVSGGPADNTELGSNTTGSSVTDITINGVTNHQHSIATQGGDDPHNNMQPTLFMGNTFIYSGKHHKGAPPLLSSGYYYV